MNEVTQKVMIAALSGILSASVSGTAVYVGRAIRVEPRLEAIERTLERMERHLYQAPAPVPRSDRQ